MLYISPNGEESCALSRIKVGGVQIVGSGSMREILDAVCTANPPFPRDVANGVPEDLQAITLACLSWDPLRRPTAEQLAVELGRYLAGEPVRLRPALYTDILRRRLTEYAQEVVKWRHQGMISQDEADRMETVHRRILAEEDHWIVDARRITLAQTALYTGTCHAAKPECEGGRSAVRDQQSVSRFAKY